MESLYAEKGERTMSRRAYYSRSVGFPLRLRFLNDEPLQPVRIRSLQAEKICKPLANLLRIGTLSS
jgi:hypothetical protein